MIKSNRSVLVIAGLAGLAVSASSALAQNTGAFLQAGSHSYTLGSNTSGSIVALPTANQGANPSTNFRVAGAGNTLNNQFNGWWYYRLDSDVRERNFANASTRTLTGTNQVEYQFNNMVAGSSTSPTTVAGMNTYMCYQLFDTGPNSACLFMQLIVRNDGAVSHTVNLFGSFDNDVGGNNANSFGGDVVSALNTSGGNRTWNITDTGATNLGLAPWTAQVVGFGADGAGVGAFSAINGQMTDTGIDNFIPDLNAGGLAAGDYAQAMQWRFDLAPGEFRVINMAIAIGNSGAQLTIVPTPGAMALLGLGGLVASRRRRA